MFGKVIRGGPDTTSASTTSTPTTTTPVRSNSVSMMGGVPEVTKTMGPLVPKSYSPASAEQAPPTVDDFIGLVQKVEAAYPDWTAEEVVNRLREHGGYDNSSWQKMLGVGDTAPIAPQGDLTAADIEALTGMVRHTHDGTQEGGIVTDRNGETVAMGHVITGLSAGEHRDKNRNLAGKLGWLGIGEKVDNLYATTLAGDLGQSATLVNEGTQTGYVGHGTEATDAELNGDIDGLLMGSHLSELTNGDGLTGDVPLSEMLSYYYTDDSCRVGGPSGPISSQRYETFVNEVDREHLEDQTKRFSVNYGYTTNVDEDGWLFQLDEDILGKDPEGLFRRTGKESEESVDAFYNWLDTKRGTSTGTGSGGGGGASGSW